MSHKIVSPESLGAALRDERKKKSLSQTTAGKSVGIDQPTVSKIEQGGGGTRLDTLFRLLASLDLELTIQPKQQANKNNKEIW